MDNILNSSISSTQHYIELAVKYGSIYGVKLIIALIIFMVGRKVARGLTNLAIKAMQKSDFDDELIGFVDSLIYWGLIAVVVIAALGQLGIQTASFIAVLGAAGLAIGLALQGSLSNFAAGVLILILRPFNVDDYVEMASAAGTVVRINIFTTELKTGDNKLIIIPNSRVLESNIINFSATGTRRVDMTFSVGYDDDIETVRSILTDIVNKDDRILHDRDTRISISELADNSVNFVVRPWVRSEDYADVKFDMNAEVKRQFDANSISIPYPQRDVHLVKDA